MKKTEFEADIGTLDATHRQAHKVQSLMARKLQAIRGGTMPIASSWVESYEEMRDRITAEIAEFKQIGIDFDRNIFPAWGAGVAICFMRIMSVENGIEYGFRKASGREVKRFLKKKAAGKTTMGVIDINKIRKSRKWHWYKSVNASEEFIKNWMVDYMNNKGSAFNS